MLRSYWGQARVPTPLPLAQLVFRAPWLPPTQPGNLTLESTAVIIWEAADFQHWKVPKECGAVIIRYKASGLLFFLAAEAPGTIKEERMILS